MPSKQTSTGAAGRKARPGSRAGAVRGVAATGERDEHYDLISVLYHSLQGAATCAQYANDARNADDDDLMAFFEESRAEYADRSQRAKELLASRLEGAAPAEPDDEDEDEDEDIEDGDEDEDDD
jgi:hypothetical protein